MLLNFTCRSDGILKSCDCQRTNHRGQTSVVLSGGLWRVSNPDKPQTNLEQASVSSSHHESNIKHCWIPPQRLPCLDPLQTHIQSQLWSPPSIKRTPGQTRYFWTLDCWGRKCSSTTPSGPITCNRFKVLGRTEQLPTVSEEPTLHQSWLAIEPAEVPGWCHIHE